MIPKNQPTTIDLEEIDGDVWHATQPDLNLIGRGKNPGRAVANFGELVAMCAYETEFETEAER